MNELIIKATNLHKSFGALEILKGISLEVYAGEIVAIVGASGAGKTTLLQILGTLEHPDSGSVIIDGIAVQELRGDAQADFRNQHIGFVFQQHQLLPEFTAEENVVIPAMIAGQSKSDAIKESRRLLTALGLSERLTHKPAALSGGEKQRVAVARALINKPSLIFADEPTGALDSENKEELHAIFRHLQQELGQTFVIVSHDPTITDIADRTIRLQDGRVLE